MIAANAWTAAQGAWLDEELGRPTTYTIVVRHEDAYADTAPGVGHTHIYRHDATSPR